MITTEGYFENIKEEILLEIKHAKKHIYIAVAWFTDRDFFNSLSNKSVPIEILVTDDAINSEVGILSWKHPSQIKVFTVTERLMHHKFCVIDNKTVITGSFNWTKKASIENDENITIIKGDFELARTYVDEFLSLTKQKVDNSLVDLSKSIKRLKIIAELIELNETDDIDLQTKRLQKENEVESITDIILCLEKKSWTEAILKIQSFLQTYSRLIKYEDPLIKILQMEIKQLEYELIALENECEDVQRLISIFNNLFYKSLGAYIDEIMSLKREYFSKHRQESQYSESEYQKAKKEYDGFSRERERIESEKYFNLKDDEVKDLKVLYKEAVLLCHPDKNPGKEKEAHEIFTKLQDAYLRQDLVVLREIVLQVKAGWLNLKIEIVSDREILIKKHGYLKEKYARKLEEINSLKISEEYNYGNKGESELQNYFDDKRSQLEKEKEYWINLMNDDGK
ncbi:MAG: phospholipase D-like domain-containing protein [Bacteroidia bacterium]